MFIFIPAECMQARYLRHASYVLCDLFSWRSKFALWNILSLAHSCIHLKNVPETYPARHSQLFSICVSVIWKTVAHFCLVFLIAHIHIHLYIYIYVFTHICCAYKQHSNNYDASGNSQIFLVNENIRLLWY